MATHRCLRILRNGDTCNDDAARNPIVQLPTNGTLKITIDPDVSPAGCGSIDADANADFNTNADPRRPTPTHADPTSDADADTDSNADPTPPTPTPARADSTSGVRSAFDRVEAEVPSANSGGVIEGGHVAGLGNGDWLEYGRLISVLG